VVIRQTTGSFTPHIAIWWCAGIFISVRGTIVIPCPYLLAFYSGYGKGHSSLDRLQWHNKRAFQTQWLTLTTAVILSVSVLKWDFGGVQYTRFCLRKYSGLLCRLTHIRLSMNTMPLGMYSFGLPLLVFYCLD
jgi:hypothetical protein